MMLVLYTIGMDYDNDNNNMLTFFFFVCFFSKTNAKTIDVKILDYFATKAFR